MAPSTASPDYAGNAFADLGVPSRIVAALAAAGVTEPFPIQADTLPDSLAGRDVLGRGRTGSGKTYAFLIPLLTRLSARPATRRPGRPRALILAPTRELAAQIESVAAPLARAMSCTVMTVFGGVGAGPQIAALRAGVDIVIACPGRLADLVSQRHASLDSIEITVLDEADHMADLGFLPTVRRLLDQTPKQGQRLLFSATLDAGVDVIVRRYLDQPVTHMVDAPAAAATTMEHHVLHVHPDHRLPVLVDLVAVPGRTIVFTRTKYGAKRLTRQLNAHQVSAVELHGNLAQSARTRNLAAFADGTATTLVATDIAARGIHIDEVRLVIHADPPLEHKAYLHRSGRTARAGASGTVVTLMTDEQVDDVRDLTRRAGIKATTTRLTPSHPLLAQLAPGERSWVAPTVSIEDTARPPRQRGVRRQPAARAVAPTPEKPAAANGGRGRRRSGSSASANPTSANPAPSGARASGASVARSTGGAAAFSAGSRLGGRRGSR